MKKSLLPLSLVSFSTLAMIASCAGPESYDQKMSRYVPKVLAKNQVPEIKSEGFSFTKKTNARAPANVAEKAATKKEHEHSTETSYTNKKLYFLTLLGQYESLKKYTAEFDAPDVRICPNFHTSLLQHNERRPAGPGLRINALNNKRFVYEKAKLGEADYVSSRPELSLPLSQVEITPKVVDIMKGDKDISESVMNELVHRALDIHLSKTYTEIRELCEYGVSDNYYIYENLITHIKNSDFKADEQNMNKLLKTTVFSNIALVTSLEKMNSMPARSIASATGKEGATTYANELMARLNIEWAKEYFDHLKTSR